MKGLFLGSIILILLFQSSGWSDEEEVYVAYPVIFVHGLASSESTWRTTKNALKQYYYDRGRGTTKYEYGLDDQSAYFPHCNYKPNNSGDIRRIAVEYLGPAIDRAMQSFPARYTGQKKVIIVAHSMGGLITMSLLSQNPSYADKIYKVLFVGTPFLGSSYASMVYILDELYKEILPFLIERYKVLSLNAGGLWVYVPNPLVNQQIYSKLKTLRKDIYLSIIWPLKLGYSFYNSTPNPDGIAIRQLRLAGPVSYQNLVEGKIGFDIYSILVEFGHNENTFYNNLTEPSQYRVISGMITNPPFSLWVANKLMGMFESNFAFPQFYGVDQSLTQANSTGDGVVSKESQEGIGRANYAIQSSHVEETSQWRTILTAIDDEPPVVWAAGIQSEYRNSEWWKRADSDKYRIVIGIKEYFLADVEIIKCELDGVSIFGGKPYDRIGRDFLRTRDVHFGNNTYKLGPGRFYIEASITPGVHELRIKVRNPAGVESKEFKIKITRPEIWNLDYIDLGGGGGTYVFDIRERLRQEVRYVRRICPADEDFSGLDEGEFVRLPGGSKHFEIREGLLPVPGYPPRMKKFGIHAVPTTEWLNGYVVRTMLKISNAAVKLIYTDPTFIKPLVESGRIEGGEIKEEEGLVARIDFPMDNSLVRADIPVCGLACGEDFYRYILDYGKGDNSTEWLEIKTSYKAETSYTHPGKPLMEYGKSIDGNLGMWETGLTEYYYKKYPVDLNGEYILRLRVFSKDGKIAEDRIKVVVGRVALNCMNNRIESSDGKVVLIVEEHSLNTHGAIMAIREVKKDIGIPEGWGIIGKIYEVIPKDIVFIKPVRLEMVYNGSEGLGLYGYAENKKEWVRFPSVWDKERKVIYTQLDLTGSDISYYTLIRTSDNYVQDTVFVPDHHKSGSFSKDTLIYCDFEKGLGTWHEMDKGWGAGLGLVNREGGGKCLELSNTRSPSHFAFCIIKEQFDIKEYPILRFDYRITPDVKINLMVKTKDGKWYEVQFTDDPKIYWDVNITPIGEVEGVKPDNKWHTAEIDLYRVLEQYTDEVIVDRIIMADWDVTGFKELVFGSNRVGARYYIDNFTIEKGYNGFTLGLPILRNKNQDYIIRHSPISSD